MTYISLITRHMGLKYNKGDWQTCACRGTIRIATPAPDTRPMVMTSGGTYVKNFDGIQYSINRMMGVVTLDIPNVLADALKSEGLAREFQPATDTHIQGILVHINSIVK